MDQDAAAPEQRNTAHRQLVDELVAFLGGTGHRFAVGTTTINGKRPDVASINTAGQLVIWEAKTRFIALERRQAWDKYHASCDLLVLVYPGTVDLTAWDLPSFIPTHPCVARVGALLLSGQHWLLKQPPLQLRQVPAALLQITQSVLRKAGSTRRNTSAAALS